MLDGGIAGYGNGRVAACFYAVLFHMGCCAPHSPAMLPRMDQWSKGGAFVHPALTSRRLAGEDCTLYETS